MNVLHLNTLIYGGAAVAVKRLHQGLVNSGVSSTILYKSGVSENPAHLNWLYGKELSFYAKLKKNLDIASLYQQGISRYERLHFLKGRPEGSESFSTVSSTDKLKFREIPAHTDIVHLHWIAGFFDYKEFFSTIPEDVPIVWTLHDMNPFTGGCHYSWDCDGYTRMCGNCPQLTNSCENDLSARIMSKKLSLFSRNPIHVVATSRWIEECARKSSIFQNAASIRTIPIGLDIEIFKPKDKIECRSELGIANDCKVILFGADGIDNKRKGLDKLIEAIKLIKEKKKKIHLLTFGKQHANILLDEGLVQHLGHISELDMLLDVYSSADVFVMPSLYEAFGQVALEAMSCGIPVVSFKNGGACDIVEDNETGMLAETGDVIDLSNKLLQMLSDDRKREEMGAKARKMVVDKFTNIQQVSKYKNLYAEINPGVSL